MPIPIEAPPAIHQQVNVDRVCLCILEVENSPWDSPKGGAYQFTEALWKQYANRIPYRAAQSKGQATIIARIVLADYQVRFINEDVFPDCYLLALAWHKGFSGAMEWHRKQIFCDYAQRCANLFDDPAFNPQVKK